MTWTAPTSIKGQPIPEVVRAAMREGDSLTHKIQDGKSVWTVRGVEYIEGGAELRTGPADMSVA